MTFRQILRTAALVSVFCVTLSCWAFAAAGSIKIVEMKTAQSIDEKYQPVKPSSNFPALTSKVFCWFKWKEGQVNSQISAKWTYLTEKIPVLDYKVAIPRREGAGGIALSMPAGKTFPVGEYEVRLENIDGKLLKSTKFRILDK